MATKKPAVKKNKVAAAKKPVKTVKKPTAKKALTKVKPAVKKIATKKKIQEVIFKFIKKAFCAIKLCGYWRFRTYLYMLSGTELRIGW